MAVSCVKPEEESRPDPSIELQTDEVTANALGGEFTVNYSIINPDDELKVEAKSDDEWITSISCEKDGELVFMIEPNEAREAREGAIVLVYGDVIEKITVIQEGVVAPAADEILGEWNVLGDRWDLDYGESKCYLMDDNSEDGYAHDENGDYITITIREFCEQYAADYNADPSNEVDGTPEDFADKLYENLGLVGTFVVDKEKVTFEWGLGVGFSVVMVDGEYEYDPVKGCMTVNDLAIASDPRELQIDVFVDEEGHMCFRYPEFYITGMTSYDQTKEYWIYAPTIFYCEKIN